MKKLKEFAKSYLIGLVLGIVVSGTIAVIAATYFPSNDVTYDNTKSGLKSTDVQGAIDELYGVCTTINIEDLLPSNPDELYKDEHGDIRYYGTNPNNYVSFNNELWRIMGVIDGKIKIIRNESIGQKYWSSNGRSNWSNSDLKKYLNVEYYNNIMITYRNMISEETYYLGGPTKSALYTLNANEYYNIERSNNVYINNPTNIKQYIGLMYPSDYGYASAINCQSIALNNYSSNSCKNYLAKIDEWLQTPRSDSYEFVTFLLASGNVTRSGLVGNYTHDVRPVLYLNSNVKITEGDGTQNNPYIIE